MASQLEHAIQEIRRGEELMKSLHSHLPLKHTPITDLSEGIQRALRAALTILRSKKTNARSGTKRMPTTAIDDDKDQKKKR